MKPCIHGDVCRAYMRKRMCILSNTCPHCPYYEPKESRDREDNILVDQLIDQVVELSKELQDSRHSYGDALSKTSSQDNLISRLHQTIRDLNAKNSINSVYIEALEEELVSRGVSQEDLDSMYQEIKDQFEGGDE